MTEAYVKAKSLGLSRTRKADISLADQEILHYYLKTMDHYHVHIIVIDLCHEPVATQSTSSRLIYIKLISK
jgi:hypothetical protein